MIQYPAKIKLKLMARRAGIPILSICSEASKSSRSLSGISWNTAVSYTHLETRVKAQRAFDGAEAKEVDFSYGGEEILKGYCLSVKPGEIVGCLLYTSRCV